MSYGKRFKQRGILSVEDIEDVVAETTVVDETTQASATDGPGEGDDVTNTEVVNTEEDAAAAEIDEVLDETPTEDEVGLDENLDKVETAVDSSEGLDAIADELEATEEDGGALPQTIAVAEIAVEAYVQRLTGVKPRKRLLLSVESCGGINQRARSTRLAVEGIRDIAQQAGKAIMELIQKVVNFFRGMWNSFTNRTAQIKERIAKYKADLASHKATVQGPQPLSFPQKVAARLKLGGKFTKEGILKGVTNLKNFLQRVLNWVKAGKKNLDEAVGNLPIPVYGEDNAPDFNLNTSDMQQATKQFGGQVESEDGALTVANREALPGDVKAEVTVPTTVEAVGSLNIAIHSSAEEDMENNDTHLVEINTNLSDQDIAFVLKNLDEIISMVDQIKAVQEESVEDVAKKGKEVADAANRATDKNDEQEKESAFKRGLNRARSFIGNAARGVANSVRGAINYVISVAGLLLVIVGHHLRQAGSAVADTAKKVVGKGQTEATA